MPTMLDELGILAHRSGRVATVPGSASQPREEDSPPSTVMTAPVV